jgi:hypothetical protein
MEEVFNVLEESIASPSQQMDDGRFSQNPGNFFQNVKML